MCDKCSDPECDVTPNGKPLPFVIDYTPDKIYEDEVIVTATSPLGAFCGRFVANKSTLPQLVAINESPEGGTYFFWDNS